MLMPEVAVSLGRSVSIHPATHCHIPEGSNLCNHTAGISNHIFLHTLGVHVLIALCELTFLCVQEHRVEATPPPDSTPKKLLFWENRGNETQRLEEELMTTRIREMEVLTELKELRLKVMELETQVRGHGVAVDVLAVGERTGRGCGYVVAVERRGSVCEHIAEQVRGEGEWLWTYSRAGERRGSGCGHITEQVRGEGVAVDI